MKFKREVRWEFWLGKVDSNLIQWEGVGEGNNKIKN